MFRFSFFKAVCIALLSVAFSSSALAQLCGGFYPPCPTPAAAPTPVATPTPSTTVPVTTAAPVTTAVTTTTTTAATTPVATTVTTTATTPATVNVVTTPSTAIAGIPGYAPTKDYDMGRTVAYIIAPFAIVGGSYLFGQRQVEIDPYLGFFWPGHTDSTNMRDSGIAGIRASTGLSDYFEVEGNFGYINHFESKFVPNDLDQSFGVPVHTVHGLLYDVNGVVTFGKRPVFGSRVNPYVTFGAGGLSTKVRHGSAQLVGGQVYTIDPATGSVVLNTSQRQDVVADNTPFFSFNYGGGLKTTNIWGPMGVRLDVRGRTLPNFFSDSLTWLEASGGLTFTFGQQ